MGRVTHERRSVSLLRNIGLNKALNSNSIHIVNRNLIMIMDDPESTHRSQSNKASLRKHPQQTSKETSQRWRHGSPNILHGCGCVGSGQTSPMMVV